jgi:putative FmdB family regulatory protein
MPTYTYKREDGTTFDLQQKISSDALTTCPTTGQAVKRVITGGGGVVYKGDGWYVTDYKNKGTNPAGSSPSATDKSSSKETSESVGEASSGGATPGESSTADTNAKSNSK